MPAKSFKTPTGRIITYKAYLLRNGNLVIPQIISRDPQFVGWVEVEKGTSAHKRFWPVRVTEPDPRQSKLYNAYVKRKFPQYEWTLKGTYEIPWKVKGDEHLFREVSNGVETISRVKASRKKK
jgi:hypothetical protein